MRGMDSTTGKPLEGLAHLRQSIREILSTRIGSRVLNRTFGSQLFYLIDAPLNRSTLMDIYAATADALGQWEPRLEVTAVSATSPEAGELSIDLTGIYLPDGRVVTIEGIEVR
jgi:phage baseplate assembly protein W